MNIESFDPGIIPELSTNLKQQEILQDVGTAVLSNSLDMGKNIGEDITKMMENSVNPNIGNNIDISV